MHLLPRQSKREQVFGNDAARPERRLSRHEKDNILQQKSMGRLGMLYTLMPE